MSNKYTPKGSLIWSIQNILKEEGDVLVCAMLVWDWFIYELLDCELSILLKKWSNFILFPKNLHTSTEIKERFDSKVEVWKDALGRLVGYIEAYVKAVEVFAEKEIKKLERGDGCVSLSVVFDLY